MFEASSPEAIELTALPSEILHNIAWIYVCDMTLSNNVGSVLSTCQLFRTLFLPKVYSSISLLSLDQLACFLSPTSGAHTYCPRFTNGSVVINIPGVPGGGDGTLSSSSGKGKERSRDRLLLTAQVLALCPRVHHVSLEFFSIRHSGVLTSDAFRQNESELFANALRNLTSLKSLRWIPPRREPSAIMGLSIVVVDQVIETLAKGLVGCGQLRTLELWNTMLPADGGVDLARTLVRIATSRHDDASDDETYSPSMLSLNLRSVTGLDPKVISLITMATPFIKVNIADGFIGSIWGPRIDHDAIKENLLDTMDPARTGERSPSSTSSVDSRGTSPDSQIQVALKRATDNVTIKVLKSGIAGSRYASV